MSLYGALSTDFDAGAMFAQIAYEVNYGETRVSLISTRRNDMGSSEVAIDGCKELSCQFRKVAPDEWSNFMGLVSALE